jgi:hypothetical protein
LYMAATDPDRRLKGVVSINGWTPMREDTNASVTGGIRRLWDWHALQPALGFFDGREASLPFDMDDVMAEVGGSVPILIYQQDLDRENDAKGVRRAVARAQAAGANVTLETAPTVNMLNDAAHTTVVQWLAGVADLVPTTAEPCARGLPANMTPLRLVKCGDPQLLNQTLFELVSINGSTILRLSACSTHAVAIDCAQAGGMEQCGDLAVPEKIVLSGALNWTNHHDLSNFHFLFDAAKGELRDATGRLKCFQGSGEGGQVVLAECSRSNRGSSSAGAAAQKWKHLSASGQFKWEGTTSMGAGGVDGLCLGWIAAP